ncbi:hypothetical protein QBC42DRAFT_285733 [Cladorrhinum samala]|uniref:Uncharacterized protein n=1 Tax=Cladorrhinum samala TaxID=585594 RepID=A0AAV9HUW3_9PEZI|nr:hypothetical protein QBC42DRAFT_285733 [Cladorrhinum samala]
MTLCFAPLVTHFFIGLPIMVNQTTRRIPWRCVAPLLHPTTILWRYMTILDRRLRCRRWTPERFSATNAAFFTHKGWTSSEQKMEESLRDLVRWPPSTRASLLSVSVLGTLVVAIQGVQVLNEMIIVPTLGLDSSQGVATVFFPLAIISLFRLFPALCITQDFAFREDRARAGIEIRRARQQPGGLNAASNASISDQPRLWPAIALRISAVLVFTRISTNHCLHLAISFSRNTTVSELMRWSCSRVRNRLTQHSLGMILQAH